MWPARLARGCMHTILWAMSNQLSGLSHPREYLMEETTPRVAQPARLPRSGQHTRPPRAKESWPLEREPAPSL